MTNQTTRRTFNAGLGAAALAPVGALAQDAALIEAAKKEGQVVWYTGIIVNQFVRPMAQGFEKLHGIKVNFASVGEAEMMLRITNEARANAPVGDVFDSSGALFPPLQKAGLVAQYKPANASRFPVEAVDADGHWTSVYTLYLTTGFNTDLVKEEDAPKTYADLLDPKWAGKMVWADTRALSGPAGVIGNILNSMGESTGLEYLRKLAKQKVVGIPANQRVALDQVIAGQYPIGLNIYNHHTVISRAQGAPVKRIKMEPFLGHLGAIAIVKNAPHPNAARLFVEYMCSIDGQKVVRDANYPPSHPQVPPLDPITSPQTDGFKFMMLKPEMSVESLPKWLSIYDELFK